MSRPCPRPPPPHYQVAVVLSGRQAGKKVVVIKQYDDGTKERPYPHAIVAGIEKYPLKVTKSMGAKRVARRSRVKPFIKVRLNVKRWGPGWCARARGDGLCRPLAFAAHPR